MKQSQKTVGDGPEPIKVPNPVGSTPTFSLSEILFPTGIRENTICTTQKSGVFVPDFSAQSYNLRVTILNPKIRVQFVPKPDCKISYPFGETEREIFPVDTFLDREFAKEESA